MVRVRAASALAHLGLFLLPLLLALRAREAPAARRGVPDPGLHRPKSQDRIAASSDVLFEAAKEMWTELRRAHMPTNASKQEEIHHAKVYAFFQKNQGLRRPKSQDRIAASSDSLFEAAEELGTALQRVQGVDSEKKAKAADDKDLRKRSKAAPAVVCGWILAGIMLACLLALLLRKRKQEQVLPHTDAACERQDTAAEGGSVSSGRETKEGEFATEEENSNSSYSLVQVNLLIEMTLSPGADNSDSSAQPRHWGDSDPGDDSLSNTCICSHSSEEEDNWCRTSGSDESECVYPQ